MWVQENATDENMHVIYKAAKAQMELGHTSLAKGYMCKCWNSIQLQWETTSQ